VRLRHLMATASLVVGLTGAGIVALNSSTVVGSTSDAGVVTVCMTRSVCKPGGGPIRVIPITPPVLSVK
jgi:hypothetical protein